MLLNIDRGYSLPTINVLSKNKKNITIFNPKFPFYSHEILLYILHGHVFVIRPVFSQRGSNNYVHWIFFYYVDVPDLYHKL